METFLKITTSEDNGQIFNIHGYCVPYGRVWYSTWPKDGGDFGFAVKSLVECCVIDYQNGGRVVDGELVVHRKVPTVAPEVTPEPQCSWRDRPSLL